MQNLFSQVLGVGVGGGEGRGGEGRGGEGRGGEGRGGEGRGGEGRGGEGRGGEGRVLKTNEVLFSFLFDFWRDSMSSVDLAFYFVIKLLMKLNRGYAMLLNSYIMMHYD